MKRVVSVFMVVIAAACSRVLDIGEQAVDGPCGEGTMCRAGVVCEASCKQCFCNDKNIWLCSPTCSVDSGCPASAPSDGTACATSERCVYKNVCGQLDVALCVGSKWQYYIAKCPPPPGCPPGPPPMGAPCTQPIKCPYTNKCGVDFHAVCDGKGWFIERPPHCPELGCPAEPPASRATCSGDIECIWPNACGTRDFAKCTGGYWVVDRSCTPAGCPALTPLPGQPCPQPDVSCEYKTGCEGGVRTVKCAGGAWSVSACSG